MFFPVRHLSYHWHPWYDILDSFACSMIIQQPEVTWLKAPFAVKSSMRSPQKITIKFSTILPLKTVESLSRNSSKVISCRKKPQFCKTPGPPATTFSAARKCGNTGKNPTPNIPNDRSKWESFWKLTMGKPTYGTTSRFKFKCPSESEWLNWKLTTHQQICGT